MDFKEAIVYDVPKNSLRRKITKYLEKYGLIRLQYSVFVGDLSQNKIENLAIELKELIGKEEADIRVFYICRHRSPGHYIISETETLASGNKRPVEGKTDQVIVI